MPEQVLPNFLLIGSPKAGTTWLYNVLKQHPDIYLPQKKEVNFFYRHILTHDLSWYASFYDDPEARAASAVGDVTPLYCKLSLAGVRNVKAALPNAKVILIARDPIDRDVSNGIFDLGYVEQRDRTDVSEYLLYQRCTRCRTRRGSDYQAIYNRWTSVFGKDAVHVAQFEDLHERPVELLRDVLAHIGVQSGSCMQEAIENAKKGDSASLIPPERKVEANDFIRWALAKRWASYLCKVDIPGLDASQWSRRA